MKIPASHLALRCFSPALLAARPQSQDEQNACMNDAFKVCGHAIPDRDRVAACLSENINRISIAVPHVMQRYRSRTPASTDAGPVARSEPVQRPAQHQAEALRFRASAVLISRRRHARKPF